MKVCCVQFNPVWLDEEANLVQLTALFKANVEHDKPDVVVLPELFHSGFSMDTQAISQTRCGAVYQCLSRLAKTYSLTLIAGVALKGETHHKQEPPVFNTALVFDPEGNEQACYIKNHSFSYSGEHHHYQQDNKQVVFTINGTSCSVFICYDLRFPELFRQVAKQVEVVFVIANWPDSRQQHWQTLLQARAIENQCLVVGVNRIGEDGNGLSYQGGSSIISPLGETLAYMDADSNYLVTEVDPKQTQQVRTRFPFLNDMK